MSSKIGEEVKSTYLGLITLVTDTLSKVDEEQISRCVEQIVAHRENSILVIGAGRSGLVARIFALRLLHLGYRVHVLGDTLVPSIGEEDMVLALSGSGSTKLVVTAVEAAKHVGATVICITSFSDSPLAKLADHVLLVKGRVMGNDHERRDYFARQILGLHEPLAPLGTVFEDACAILLDAIVSVMMTEFKVTEEELSRRHANIE